jgi:TPP-dependent pyruvate/acetoin dehydrogenase alpha subunit
VSYLAADYFVVFLHVKFNRIPLTSLNHYSFSNPAISFDPARVLDDYRLASISRACSMLVRKEVFSGRAKFGIYGDGKELCQLALARSMQQGDYVSGYYRDQTIGVAIGDLTWPQYFAQLYGHPDIQFDPHSGGRQMNNHHATRWLDEKGEWIDQTSRYNSVAGISSTAAQAPRALGIAYASKLYRERADLKEYSALFSKGGKEVCFTTIGDASTSEGMYLECINAAGVLQVPIVFSVWDDGYGISVPIEYQTTKSSISKALSGYQRTENEKGLEIIQVKAWDYPGLIDAYQRAARLAREEMVPCLVHVIECTQPGVTRRLVHTKDISRQIAFNSSRMPIVICILLLGLFHRVSRLRRRYRPLMWSRRLWRGSIKKKLLRPTWRRLMLIRRPFCA